ncbi:MAG: cupredoxin domain-containing protein [Deltaproteobacteria bacterium]|nr:cupredoxin domain-containing protein [Deltaproteobacteria bacterium]
MKLKRLFLITVFTLVAMLASAGTKCIASEQTQQFFDAFDRNEMDTLSDLVKQYKAQVPDEIKLIIEAAQSEKSEDKRDARFYMAETVAKMYMDLTRDPAPLLDAMRKSFESKLTTQERPAPAGGVYIVELPKAAPGEKNKFRPNNIIIKKGSTVRWVNEDATEHIFATMLVISQGKIFSPRVKPGASWEQKFDGPGEYFYVCFIHHSMIGKITVEE